MLTRRFQLLVPCLLAGSFVLPLRGGEPGPHRLPKVRVAADGSGFLRDGKPFVPIGLTYFRPHTGWAPQVWKQFDPEATRADFRRMKALGVTVVRVFLTYGSFLPISGPAGTRGAREAGSLPRDRRGGGNLRSPDRSRSLGRDSRLGKRGSLRRRGPLEGPGGVLDGAGGPVSRPRRHLGVRPAQRAGGPLGWRGHGARWNQWLETTYKTPRPWRPPGECRSASSGSAPFRSPRGTSPARSGAPRLPAVSRVDRRRMDAPPGRGDPGGGPRGACHRRADPVVGAAEPGRAVALRRLSAPPDRAAGSTSSRSTSIPWTEASTTTRTPRPNGATWPTLHAVVREAAVPGKPLVLAEFGWYGGGKPTLDGGTWPAATEADQARWCRLAVETTRGLAAGWLNWGLYDHPEAGDITQLSGLLTVDGRTKAWGAAFTALSSELRAQPPRAQNPPRHSWTGMHARSAPRPGGRKGRALESFQSRPAPKP